MKKRLFVLSALLLASLVSCGGNKPAGSSSSGGSVTSSSSASGSAESSSSEGSVTSSSSASESAESSSSQGSVTSSSTTSESVESSSSVATEYAISITESSHATIHSDLAKAVAGATVTLTYEIDKDFVFSYVKMNDQTLEESNNQFVFTMPEQDVVITYLAEQYQFGIALPSDLPEGITMSVSEPGSVKPEAEVSLYVRNSVRDSKKVKSVAMNGETLTGSATNEAGCTLYKFTMPAAEVEITASIVNIYHVKVSDQASVAFGLSGNVAAEAGETVEFVPLMFAGYWAKNFTAVDTDVVLAAVEGKANAYSFVMPDHDVTIDATIGQVGYKVSYKTNSLYRITYHADSVKDVYLPGDEVKFKCESTGKDASIAGVKVNGAELGEADEEGYYSFVVEAHENFIEPVLSYNYKGLETVSSEHYDFTLTTMVDGEEVDAENHVLSNQTVYINATEKADAGENKLIPSTFTIYAGENREDALEVKSLTVSLVAPNKYSFKTSSYYAYYRVECAEAESDFKGNMIVGEYNTGMRPFWSQNYRAKVDAFGVMSFTSSNSGVDVVPTYSSATKQLAAVEGDPNHYTANTSGTENVFFNGSDAMLYIGGTSKGSHYLYAKDKGGNVSLKDDGGTHTYSYMYYSSSKIMKQFFHLECANGEVITAFYDEETKSCKWGVTATLLSGENGVTAGDKVLITDSEGNKVALFQVSKKSSFSDGFQHEVTDVTLDGLEGTYAPASEADGSANLEVTGYGLLTMGEAEYQYTVEGEFIYITIDGVKHYFVLDKETHTYTASKGPTDGYEGTYTYGEQTVVLDGYGQATIGETIYTYVISKNKITFTAGETVIECTIDKAAKTLVDYVAPLSPYADKTYQTSWDEDDGWGSTYMNYVSVHFVDDTTVSVHLFYTSAGYTTDYHTSAGTYEIDAEGNVTVAFKNRSGVNISMHLTPNESGRLKVTDSSGVYFDSSFIIPYGSWFNEIAA